MALTGNLCRRLDFVYISFFFDVYARPEIKISFAPFLITILPTSSNIIN